MNKRYKESYLDTRGMMKPSEITADNTAKGLKQFYQEMFEDFGRVSLQVVNDWKECFLCSDRSGISYMVYVNVSYLRILIERTYGICIIISLFQLMKKLRGWNATNFVQNVAYVEQKQQEILNEYGALYYEFLHEDYSESLELFEMDLKRCNGLPLDSVSRVMSLMRIIYGNRTDIENGLVNT